MRASKLIRDLQRPDAPGAAEERIRYRAMCNQAIAEMVELFPSPWTPAIALEAMEWQKRRIAELMGD